MCEGLDERNEWLKQQLEASIQAFRNLEDQYNACKQQRDAANRMLAVAIQENTKNVEEIKLIGENNRRSDEEMARLRNALKLIRMYAGNNTNHEADKAAIRGIVDDVLEDGEK